MYSFAYNDRTVRRFICKDGIYRVVAKDIADAIGNNNLTRDLGTNGKKAITIVDENLLPSLTLNEKSALLISFEETLSYLDSRRKNKELGLQLKEYLTEHWNDETEETEFTNDTESENDDDTLFKIDAENSRLHIGDTIVPYGYDNKGDIAFRAKNLCLSLGYTNTKQAVSTHTSQRDIVTIVYDKSPHHSPDATILCGPGFDGRWLNELGVYKLVFGTKKPIAERIQNWIFATVKPFISSLQQCALFFDLPVNAYEGTKVLYLFWLKKLNALKFGVSENLQVRSTKHKRSFGDVSFVHAIETPYAYEIEQSLKTAFNERKWKLNGIVVDGHKQSEILDLTKTTIDDVIALMNKFTKLHCEVIQKRERDIVEKSMEFEQEITKRRKMELEFEIRKLELELEIKKQALK